MSWESIVTGRCQGGTTRRLASVAASCRRLGGPAPVRHGTHGTQAGCNRTHRSRCVPASAGRASSPGGRKRPPPSLNALDHP